MFYEGKKCWVVQLTELDAHKHTQKYCDVRIYTFKMKDYHLIYLFMIFILLNNSVFIRQ